LRKIQNEFFVCGVNGCLHLEMENRKFDLTERLINFASDCVDVSEGLPNTYAGNHYSTQLVRSSASPMLNYGEAQGAESRSDFIHKMGICLKELRESFNCLRLIDKRKWFDSERLIKFKAENNELIAIFVASLKTAGKKIK